MSCQATELGGFGRVSLDWPLTFHIEKNTLPVQGFVADRNITHAGVSGKSLEIEKIRLVALGS